MTTDRALASAAEPIPVARLVERTLRVPRVESAGGDGAAVARQTDAVLASVGFTCSGALLDHLATAEPGAAMDRAVEIIAGARQLVGDHVEHNAYFRDFPRGVPDTVEFWVSCLRDALGVGTDGAVRELPFVNLLELPAYGRYQHTFDELVAAHDELVTATGDRLTVLHLGGTPDEELDRLLRDLAGSGTPLTAGDRDLLTAVVTARPDTELPDVPVRENRALVDAARLAAGQPLGLVGSPTDVLRVAAAASGGDVTLTEPTRFRSFPRSQRRLLLSAVDRTASPDTLGDVRARREQWKRLGERLHPGEFRRWPRMLTVFAVAHGEQAVSSPVARAEQASDPVEAARALRPAPGVLLRWADRLLREAGDRTDAVLAEIERALPHASGRVLCSLREHVDNRLRPAEQRVFVNRRGRAHTEPDRRPTLWQPTVARLREALDTELAARMPAVERLVLDPAVLELALPLSGKASGDGFAVVPRGTTTGLPPGDTLRFFTYWHQRARRTDYDLSVLLLDARLHYVGHVSWTRLRGIGAVHSGDVTEAPDGATEFIDIDLGDVHAHYVVPQVNVYSGEGFDEVAESLFGYMIRDAAQQGRPFEPRTVRARSEMRGAGTVALPAAFHRAPTGGWQVTWLHLTLRGHPHFNVVEGNRISTTALLGAILDRRHLTVGYLTGLLAPKAGSVTEHDPSTVYTEPVTFVGLERPDGLPDGSEIITLDRLSRLVPS